MDYLYTHGEVLNANYDAEAIKVRAKIPNRYLKALDQLVTHSSYTRC